jgi:ferredoxin-type protein NapF
MDLRRRLLLRGSWRTARAASDARAPSRPPWAVAEDRFVEQCTRCGDCVGACPRGLIRARDGGFPEIAFEHRGCTFCRACLEACDAHALDARKPAFMARVTVAEHCLARNRVECRACGDACDERALRFVPALGGISRFVVGVERCTGCGACVASCPVGAISMTVTTARPARSDEDALKPHTR